MTVEVIKTFTTTCYGAVHDAVYNDLAITAILEQVVASGGSTTSFFFDVALSGPEDIALDNLLAAWVCPTEVLIDTEDTQVPDTNSDLSEPMAFNSDVTRGDKKLSLEVINLGFSKNEAKKNTWIEYAGESESNAGYVASYAGTVIRATAYSSDTDSAIKGFNLYVNNSNQGNILSFAGSGNEELISNSIIDIDFAAGDKIRIRADNVNKKIKKLVITLSIKWRVI